MIAVPFTTGEKQIISAYVRWAWETCATRVEPNRSAWIESMLATRLRNAGLHPKYIGCGAHSVFIVTHADMDGTDYQP